MFSHGGGLRGDHSHTLPKTLLELQAQAPTLASFSPLLQGFSEKTDFPHSVLQPPQGCVKLEFFLLPVEGHWQVAELHRKDRCQEVRNSTHPPTLGLHSPKGYLLLCSTEKDKPLPLSGSPSPF